MKEGKFIGVGIGPGDPELITLKAVAALNNADVICAPRSENSSDSIAYGIIRPYCDGKKIVDMSFSMAPVHANREPFWRRHAGKIVESCTAGKTVAFVTLGDPGLFSSFEYVVRLVREISPETAVEIIPGITSIAAATATLGMSLAQAEESVTIQPCSRVLDRKLSWWNSFDCVVIMKIGKRLTLLIEKLEGLDLIKNAVMVTRAGFRDGAITSGRDLLNCTAQQGYLATMIVRPEGIPNKKEGNQ